MAKVDSKKPQTGEKDRMQCRLDSKIKARNALATAISGQRLTDCAVSTLTAKVDQILARDDTILLSSDDYTFFLKALDDDRKPSKRSLAAAKQYWRGRRDQ